MPFVGGAGMGKAESWKLAWKISGVAWLSQSQTSSKQNKGAAFIRLDLRGRDTPTSN
jgi:hypothetical protein